ncbi:MAG: putative lipid II flippase FtsW [Candidatus Eremiobacteraeota bacterium]|nr:putative lipid II flippase FtsW [Candidatus Eremiobacteraeota bacterium]
MTARRAPDVTLLVVAGVLTAIGAIMVFSASSVVGIIRYHDAEHFVKRELIWVALGALACWIGVKIDYGVLRRAAPWLLGVAVALLIGVLFPHFGMIEGGARRWYEFGLFSFEPSEFVKLALIVFLAKLLADREENARDFSAVAFPALFWVGVCFMLVLRQPDLGTATLFLMIAFVMLFVAGARLRHLAIGVAVAVPALLAFVYASPYRRARFTAFLDPNADPKGTGYHILQSLYGLGSGGIFGVGLGESRQKFGYLPEQYTDFIFSVLGEELGFIGAAAVIVLFLLLAYRGICIALRAEDRFGFFLAVGITASIALQAFINIGVVTSTWPVTGVPLPFISYGGTSLVMSLFGVGLLASISRGRSRAAIAADERIRDPRNAHPAHGRRHGRSFVPRAVTRTGALRRAR